MKNFDKFVNENIDKIKGTGADVKSDTLTKEEILDFILSTKPIDLKKSNMQVDFYAYLIKPNPLRTIFQKDNLNVNDVWDRETIVKYLSSARLLILYDELKKSTTK